MSAETGRIIHRALRRSLGCLAEKTLRTAARSVSALGSPFAALGAAAWLDGAGVDLGSGRLSGLCIDTAARSASSDSICKESSGSGEMPDGGVCRATWSAETPVVDASNGASSSSCGTCVAAILPSPAARLASSAFFSASISRLT